MLRRQTHWIHHYSGVRRRASRPIVLPREGLITPSSVLFQYRGRVGRNKLKAAKTIPGQCIECFYYGNLFSWQFNKGDTRYDDVIL